MAVNLSPVGGVAAQFFDNDGNVLSGGKIYTYSAGTSTPATTYTSSNGSIAHSNPIILDSAGRVPTGEIWLTDGINYKFVLNNSSNTLIGTYDNISGINSNFVAYTNSQEIQTATSGQTVFTLTTMQYQVATNSLSVFVDGVNQYGPGAQYAYTETSSTSVTFVNGLHVGALVKFTSTQQQGAGAIDASQVSYTPAGTGAVTTNVQAKLRQSVSVNDFGASSTATSAQNKTAIQAAINSGAKRIYFPDASYSVDPGLTVNANGLSLYGNSAIGGTALNFAAGASDALAVGTTTNVSGFSIRDIELNGNSTTPGTQNTNGLVLGNVSPSYYAISVDISNCYIHNFLATGAAAIRLNYSFWINVKENTNFAYCYYCVYVPAGGIVTTASFTENTKFEQARIGFFNECATGGNIDQITFNNCSFEYNALTAIYSTAPQAKYDIKNCYFEVNSTTVGTNGQIYITSSDTSTYGFATAIVDGCQFHRVVSPATLGFDVNLGYCARSIVQNLNGVNNFYQAANAQAIYFNNRGNGAGNPLADYKALLGRVNAYEQEPSTGYWQNYSSDRFSLSDTHFTIQQTTKPTAVVAAGAGVGATVVVANGSTDNQGRLDLTPGTSPAAGDAITVTFNKTFTTTPLAVVVSYGNNVAAGPSMYATGVNATSFKVGFNGTPVAGLQNINYIIIGGQ
jgi:hypothetical protein